MIASLYLGAGLGPLSILGIEHFGWRSTLEYIGYSGIACGILGLIFIREPERGKFKSEFDV
jgi:hypothetical protein